MRTLSTDQTLRSIRAAVAANKAASGSVAVRSAAPGQKQRTIFNAHNTQNLPGQVVRTEGSADTGDVTVDEAYHGLGDTYDFYQVVFNRDSIDDEGMPMNGTVHFGEEFNNAFWDGERMVFGDGDGEIFKRFTSSLDVIGHELAHGVTEDEAKLMYLFQPGALNESMSDVFGSLVKQKRLNQTAAQADWLIGAELLNKQNVNGVALRSMSAPGTAYDDPLLGKDPQPAHMSDFVKTFEDNGGVHINSGIPNKAFHLVATQLGGYAWERAGRIWYETLRDSRVRPNTGFQRFARLTLSVSDRLFGAGSPESQAVSSGWQQVGLAVQPLTLTAS
jgi:Zn-dependent metalloprotease